MRPRYEVKREGDKYDIGVDWTDVMESIPDAVSLSAWELIEGDVELNPAGSPGPTHDGMVTSVWFAGGTPGTDWRVRNSVTTAGGREFTEDIVGTVYDPQSAAESLTGRYCSLADVEAVFGRNNVAMWAEIEGGDVPATNSRIQYHLDYAADLIDLQMGGGLYKLPFTDTGLYASVPGIIRHIAASFAGVSLYEARGIADVDEATGRPIHRLSWHRRRAEALLSMVRSGAARLDVPADRLTMLAPGVVREYEYERCPEDHACLAGYPPIGPLQP